MSLKLISNVNLFSNDSVNFLSQISSTINRVQNERKATRNLLLDQIQMFENLLNDKTGLEIAYRRMHKVNQLIRDIDSFISQITKNNIQNVVLKTLDEAGKY